MEQNEGILSIYYQNQSPLKLYKKYSIFLSIALLITFSFIRVNSEQTKTFVDKTYSYEESKNRLSISSTNQSIDTSHNLLVTNNPVVKEVNNSSEKSVDSTNNTIVRNWRPLELPTGQDPNHIVIKQRNFIKDMMRHSWNKYVKYAWVRMS